MHLHHILAVFRHISPVRTLGDAPTTLWAQIHTLRPLHVSVDFVSNTKHGGNSADVQQPARERCESLGGRPLGSELDGRRSLVEEALSLRGANAGRWPRGREGGEGEPSSDRCISAEKCGRNDRRDCHEDSSCGLERGPGSRRK